MKTEIKRFIPLNVSSKFAICGIPLRLDTYKNCSFGCKYCFSTNREIMKYDKQLQVANVKWLDKKLNKVLVKKEVDKENFLEVLISKGVTLHCGGMSDPFQPCEENLKITKQIIDVCNKYGLHILFSTKSDTTYDCDIRPNLHTFQLSVTNVDDMKWLETNVPSIENRKKFYLSLKEKGFKVGIRVQPFIPGISDCRIIDMFENADNFTIEGIKIVPQNKLHKEFMFEVLKLNKDHFTQKGLLNLKPLIRLELYKEFISKLESLNIPYSVADNDLHWIGTNKCCCGDNLVYKSTTFNNTALIKEVGLDYTLENTIESIGEYRDCKCNHLFTSNRQEGCKNIYDFYLKRFDRKTSPFSPKFQFKEKTNE